MLQHLPLALITAQRAMDTEIRSALPDAPQVAEATTAEVRPSVYRTRAAIATSFARVADAVAPMGWTPHRTASSR
jgi:hypothetical protein